MKIIKLIINFLLSATILVSTIGIPVNRHYCLNKLQDVRLFAKAIPCAMEQAMIQHACPIPLKNHDGKPVNGCCHDTHELVKFTNLQNSITCLELVKLFAVSVVTFAPHQSLFNNYSNTLTFTSDHSPPLIEPDRTVKFHSFLI